MAYNKKWTPEFPASVGNALRPTDPINNTEDYQTDGFPQFMANDPVRYDLQNAGLKQLLSNDERLNEKISVTNSAHNTDPKAHSTGIAGNAATATKLATTRKINGVGFDGSKDITVADDTKLPLSGGTLTGQLIANGGVKGDLIGNAATATNISNTGTVVLATPTEANQIDVTQPSYKSLDPVKLLNFHWYNDTYSLGAIRSDSTPIYGLGIYLNGVNKAYWDSSGNYRQATGAIFSDSFLLLSSGSTGISWGGGDVGSPIEQKVANLKISSWYSTGFYDGCTGNGYTVGINHRNGDIKTKGSVVASGEVYAQNGWFRSDGDNGWINEKHGGGWYMSDDTWIRAYNGKNVYTPGAFQADGGFNGNLHGTADSAKNTEYVANDNMYMRFHWAGQGGQPTWLWGGNDASHMYVYNPSNFNVNSVGGYTADALRNRTSGRNTPVLTPLLDKSQGTEINTNAGTGIQGQGNGDLHLVQSYQNFDKILICWANDNMDFFGQTLWEKWELDYAFGNTYRFSLHKAGDNPYWVVWSSVKLGTADHPYSTTTLWRTQDQNSMIKEIYGLTY